VNVYVDASVVLRVVLGEPEPLADWPAIDRPLSSRLLRVECLRALDRARTLDRLDDATLAERRGALLEILAAIDVVPLDEAVFDRAGEPFPTQVRTLDAIHLASALGVRDQLDGLVFATHDATLALAATAMGFDVRGA
jgi:predicted nucleic acid-binding protein